MQASCTKPRKLEASYSQRMSSLRFHGSPAKKRSTPAPFVPPETPAILGLQFPGGPMRGNQIHAILLAVVIEVEVETQLDEGDRMMIGGMCTYRKRDPGDPQSPGFSPLCRVS
jgi:hypothetical protein